MMLITSADCSQLLCEGYEVFFRAQIRFQREQSRHVMHILRPSSEHLHRYKAAGRRNPDN